MKFKNLVIALIIILFSAVMPANTNAQEWSRYEYFKTHHYYPEYAWRGRSLFGFLHWGWKAGYRRDFYYCNSRYDSTFKAWDDEYDNMHKDGKYYHTYRKDARYDGEGYHRYYHNYNRYYYDRYYDDNFRPQVDDNK